MKVDGTRCAADYRGDLKYGSHPYYDADLIQVPGRSWVFRTLTQEYFCDQPLVAMKTSEFEQCHHGSR